MLKAQQQLPFSESFDRLLTVRETAARLRLNPSTIRQMVLERKIDAIRPAGRAVRIPESVVKRIVEGGVRAAIAPKEAL